MMRFYLRKDGIAKRDKYNPKAVEMWFLVDDFLPPVASFNQKEMSGWLQKIREEWFSLCDCVFDAGEMWFRLVFPLVVEARVKDGDEAKSA